VNPEILQNLETLISQGQEQMTKEIVQQILQTKVELETNQVKFPDFKKVVEDIDSQVFTIDELKESFENKGLADVLSNSSKLN
jgi:hypothetical protein